MTTATNSSIEQEKRRNKKKKDKKRKRDGDDKKHDNKKNKRRKLLTTREQPIVAVDDTNGNKKKLSFDYKYILAPMVGASELAFRLLCRKYGAQLAYTPMMSSTQFARDEMYRRQEFQTISPQDRPLVCHFSANDPTEFAQAARLCQASCDAIDLNLGCPQRTAHVGHFGSYLLGKQDRELVLSIVRAGVAAVSIPIFCKIRLLDSLPETIELCQQLRDAGASLIAIHARYRATFHRNGPGARDGPALLDQVEAIKKAVTGIPIISNGNVISYDDVVENLKSTGADGIMSAEGILDNPALFLPRHGSREEDKQVTIANPSPLPGVGVQDGEKDQDSKKKRKLLKKLRKIEKIQAKLDAKEAISEKQTRKLATRSKVQQELAKLDQGRDEPLEQRDVSLSELYKTADDKLALACEYLDLVCLYPTAIRTVVFHTRRMLKDMLVQYQLMEDCVASQTVEEVQSILDKICRYRDNPTSFLYDVEKAKREKEALERKRREESKRKNFEARMVRKAKREGKQDLEHYLRIGAEVPTIETIQHLVELSKQEQLEYWKKGNHSQHCMAFHLDKNGCERNRACAFLHVAAKGGNSFVESDEVAG